MKTVLVAEDERAARVSLTALVEAAGLRVIPAEDGKTALSLLLHEEPDAALLDIRMPGIDGLEVLRTPISTVAGPSTGNRSKSSRFLAIGG